jgi:hypothetical protein
LTPLYILNEMTEEQFAILFHERNKWIRAQMRAASSEEEQPAEPKRISADEFFANMKTKVTNVTAENA